MRSKQWKTKAGRVRRQISAMERQIAFNKNLIAHPKSGADAYDENDIRNRKAANERMEAKLRTLKFQ
jgi:hypothetical protein